MKSRRKAREAALQALYQCDTQGDWSLAAIDLYFEIFHADLHSEPVETAVTDSLEFARSLIFGVIEHFEFIDTQIASALTHWSLARMARVDRNILRLATFELAFRDDIPPSVSLDEAIEIAKRFGSNDSPTFVNGVLDNVAKTFAAHPELAKAAQAKSAEQNTKLAVG